MQIPLHTCADFSNICGVHHMLFAVQIHVHTDIN